MIKKYLENPMKMLYKMYLIFLFIICYYTMPELEHHVENENEENEDGHHEENDNEGNFLGQTGVRNTKCGRFYKRWILLIVAIVVISNTVTAITFLYSKVFPIN